MITQLIGDLDVGGDFDVGERPLNLITHSLMVEYSCKVIYDGHLQEWALGATVFCIDLPGTLYEQISIDLFYNNFSPSGEQPEHHEFAHEL